MTRIFKSKSLSGLALAISSFHVHSAALNTAPEAPVAPLQASSETFHIAPDYHGSTAFFQTSIAEIEDREGVYDLALIPQYVGLGSALQSQGEHQLAAHAFRRAIHLSRINYGLRNGNQIPILKTLIENYNEGNDWDNSARKLNYLYNLQKRQFDAHDPRLLPTIFSIINWHIRASERELSSQTVIGLMRAHGLLNLTIAIIEKNFGSNDIRLADALYNQAATFYRLELYRSRINDHVGPGLKNNPSQNYHIIHDREQISALINPYKQGKEALLRRMKLIMERAESEPKDKVESMMALADWEFLFNKRAAAEKIYAEMHSEFSENKNAQTHLLQAFDEPTALSFKRTSFTPEKPLNTAFVEARFNVNADGKAKDVEIIGSAPPDEVSEELKRLIQKSRFRPRIIKGKPVPMEGVTYKHVYELKKSS